MAKHTWLLPSPTLFQSRTSSNKISDDWLRSIVTTIAQEFTRLGINASVGPAHIMSSAVNFEILPGQRARVSKIASLAPDLEIALGTSVQVTANSKLLVRVERENRQIIKPRFVRGNSRYTVYLGQSNDTGGDIHLDISTSPHVLIAGTTGSGKSVCLNTILVGLLMSNTPVQLELHMIDPKRVELAPYTDLPHLGGPIIVDMDRAVQRLVWLTEKMDKRYDALAKHGYRSIDDVPSGAMSRVILVIEEMADLMLTHKKAERYIVRLAQKGRAAGIHLILVTQQPKVKVVTSLIKTNVPTRIAFRVPTYHDSKTILDYVGAERLLGAGDMIIISPGSDLTRGQCALTSSQTIHAVCNHWREQKPKRKWRLFR
jgi:S-DNA-T family DNA segregation ATPase FtsK/SpoIIIE